MAPNENTEPEDTEPEDIVRLRRLAVTFRLPEQRSRILDLLLSRPTVSCAQIERLKIANHSKVAINRLRSDLKQFCAQSALAPLTIHSRRAVGYWLDADTKARIHALTTHQEAA